MHAAVMLLNHNMRSQLLRPCKPGLAAQLLEQVLGAGLALMARLAVESRVMAVALGGMHRHSG